LWHTFGATSPTRFSRVLPLSPPLSMMRLRLFSGTLRVRMALTFSVLLVLAAVVSMTHFASRMAQAELVAQREFGQNLISLLTPAVQQLVSQTKAGAIDPSLAGTLQEISENPAIGHLQVTEGGGRVLYEAWHGHNPPSLLTRLLTSEAPAARVLATEFRDSAGHIGRLELALSYGPLNANIRDLVIESTLFLGALLGMAIALTYTLLARFTAPLAPLTQFAREVSRGNWAPEVQLIDSGSLEIRELNQAFAAGSASMRHYIRSIDETRELLEHSENRLRKLVNGMHEILFELDRDGDISFLNPAWARLTGYTVEESLGRPFTRYLLEKETAGLFTPTQLPNLGTLRREVALSTATGKALWVNLDVATQHNGNGQFNGVIGTLSDITESVELNRLLTRYQDDVYHLSVTDPLTGLYNRRHFDTQLEVILADQLPHGQSVCLLILDVDGFKFINDTYGHPVGDEALRTIAKLLRERMRPHDYVACLAGDEFAMVLRNTGLYDATQIANSLHESINAAGVGLPGGQVQLQCSIGVAAAPVHGTSAQELVSAADVALYQAKRRGPNRVEVLSPDISKALMSIFSQGFQLRRALEQGNLLPAFQPIIDMVSGEPIAYEALARMQHNGTLIMAGDFINVAEELGLTREIDLHIIEQALRMAPTGYGLFLNLDPSSFNDRDFARELGALISPACQDGRSITIEITERENVIITDALVADIQYLRSLGCKLALDDFGSGYSTYHFLNLFRPEYLKIEGAFVRRMLEHDSDRKIVEHIHDLATSFGAQTIAESVENEATREALMRIGIRNAQGFHLGSPHLSGAH
jgi:diguanylate cyclase (GGDEF)-like protein/PAS domain S-box-containing protein